MKLFTNTYRVSFLFAVLVSTTFFSFTNPEPVPSFSCGNEPWSMLMKDNGVFIFYDIRECIKGDQMLCIKIVNNTGSAKKLKFEAEVANADGSAPEVFNFIKTVAPYTTEQADCSEETRLSGLSRPLKFGNEKSLVVIHFKKEGVLASN